MTPRAVLAVLVRRAAEVLAALLLLLGPALAGDRALIDFLGYSPDARYFAFEEFGVQDGSGFAYSTVYVVDLSTDSWVAGSPFKAQAGDDDAEAPLAEIRAKAMTAAQPTLKQLEIAVPTEILALLGDGVEKADGKQIKWADTACCEPGQTQEDDTYTLTLKTSPLTDDNGCGDITSSPAIGFELSVDLGDETSVLHRDDGRIPKSRGCTVDYRIYAVVMPFEQNYGRVAIISSYPFGFEGPDRRFLAVPIDF